LKGNFLKNIGDSFTVWGAGGFIDVTTSRLDYLTTDWNNGDTLLMLLNTSLNLNENTIRYLEFIGKSECIPILLIEKQGSYATFYCSFSVVKLSNDLVIGRLIYPEHQEQGFEWKSVPQKEFFKKMQEILNSKPPNN